MPIDTEDIRKGRENDWFRQNEAQLIEAARKKREAAEKARQGAEADARRQLHWRKCPKCGSDMATERIEEVEVERCPGCEGIFFDRGELETVLLRHDAHRRGFFRRLIGLNEDSPRRG